MTDEVEAAAARAAAFFLQALVAHRAATSPNPNFNEALAAVAGLGAVVAMMLDECTTAEKAQVTELALRVKRAIRSVPTAPMAPGEN